LKDNVNLGKIKYCFQDYYQRCNIIINSNNISDLYNLSNENANENGGGGGHGMMMMNKMDMGKHPPSLSNASSTGKLS
jgi:hypothetical protein